jgi:hypothetical protein
LLFYNEKKVGVFMNKLNLSIFFILLSIFGFTQEKMIPKDKNLQTNMRKLWSDHVIWTRQYIIASVYNAKDASAAVDRLMKNQEDIGNSLIPYYGKGAADILTNLLKEHISIAAEVVKAAIDNSKEKLKNADLRWHENAEKIASFLSKANPNLAKKDLQMMLDKHLSLTAQEAMNRINEKWKEDVSNFDMIFNQALLMADTIAKAVETQFSNKK